MKKLIPLFVLALLSACQDKKGDYPEILKSEQDKNPILIKNVSVFNGKDKTILRNQDVLISGGKIESVGKPKLVYGEPRVIDGTGKTLMPGLIDAHVHLGSSGAVPWEKIAPNVKYNLQAYLYSGITTVYELGGVASKSEKLNKKIAQGKILGPAIYYTDMPITVPGSHPIPLGKVMAPKAMKGMVDHLVPTIEKPEDAKKIIAKQKKKGVHYIKIVCDQIPEGTPEMSFDLMKALVDEAHKEGFKVFVHVGSAENAVNAVNAGADILAHGIMRGAITEEQAKIIADKGVPVIYTLAGFENVYRISSGIFEPSKMDSLLLPSEILEPVSGENGKVFMLTPTMGDFARDVAHNRGFWSHNLETLQRNGVKILIGTDSALPGTYPGSTYFQELEILKEYGLSNFEILSGATSGNAQVFLEKPDFGTVEEGMQADLLLLSGNPLEDLSVLKTPEMILADGVEVERIVKP